MSSSHALKLCALAAVGIACSFATLTDSVAAATAAFKQEWLWQKIVADTQPYGYMNPLKTLLEVANPANLWAMGSIESDFRSASHEKCTHGLGAVAKAHFVWKENNYTGMFQQADHCIIRMANAAAPGSLAAKGYGPFLAVKCLRDDAEAANMQFLWQVDGYDVIPKGLGKSCSYFETPLSNHNGLRDDIAMPLKDTFIKAFQGIDPHSMFLGLSQMGTGAQSGYTPIKKPYTPFALVLKPAEGLNNVECSFDKPISQLLNLESSGLGVPGKTLYEVYAVRDPSESWTSPAPVEHIGSLVLDSAFTSSTFGDRQLFFRHLFFKDELDLVSKRDPMRAAQWRAYANNEENYKHEGANIYWPLLPGGQEEIAKIAMRKQMEVPEQMLQGDLVV